MEIQTIVRSIVDLFFPARCLGCNEVVSSTMPICVNCTIQLPFTHWKMDTENEAYLKINNFCEIKAANSLLFFEKQNLTQKLLHALKYKNQPQIGTLLAQKIKLNLDEHRFDGIIIIPIHPKKMRERGYNQVKSFAEEISKRFGIPLLEGFLYRKEYNKSQTSKSRQERFSSLSSAFDIQKTQISGHYLLIDDLLTTGSTISTCTNLIKSHHSIEISVLTIGYAR